MSQTPIVCGFEPRVRASFHDAQRSHRASQPGFFNRLLGEIPPITPSPVLQRPICTSSPWVREMPIGASGSEIPACSKR